MNQPEQEENKRCSRESMMTIHYICDVYYFV